MLNVNFNLRSQTGERQQVIYLVLRWHGNYYRYTTKFKVLPRYWDTKKQRVRMVINEAQKDVINKYLNGLENAAKSIYAETVAENKEPTKEIFKNKLDTWTGRTVIDKPNFWKYVNAYIENSCNRIDPKTGKTIGKRTVQEYATTSKALKEFEAENGTTIDFDTIGIDTLTEFRNFLTTAKGYAVNNIAKHIDNLRQFLRAAASDKIVFDFDVIDNKKFANARETAYNVYLNENEIDALFALDLSGKPSLEKARDLFLIGCYTGLRVSDYNNLKPHNIKGDFIDIYQSKTGGRVVIPIHPKAKEIIKKYEGGTFPKMSDQKLNVYIKEICKLANIVEQTEKNQTKGGAKVVKVMEKWEMVSSHTARRSFASNAVKQGLPIQTIMQITGHKKEVTFLKYVKLTGVEHAEIMRKAWEKGGV